MLVLLLTSVVAVAPQGAQAAAPEKHCEPVYAISSNITSASGPYAGRVGIQGGFPTAMATTAPACPAAAIDSGWTYYYGLDRYVINRIGGTTRNGVTYDTYAVTQSRRDCVCDVFTVLGSESWQVSVPYHYVPRLATNSGLINDAVYVTQNGRTFKLADLKFNLAFVEDPIGKLQRGYFSQLSVTMQPTAPTSWTWSASKTQGQKCDSYPETVGGRENWYLRCDVDITFTDPTKTTTRSEVQLGGTVGAENAKATGTVIVSNVVEVPATNVYYKAQIKVALGVDSAANVRRTGDCKESSMSYVISVFNPQVPWIDITDTWAVHGGRCLVGFAP